MTRATVAVTMSILAALTVSACGTDDAKESPETKTKTSASTSPSASPEDKKVENFKILTANFNGFYRKAFKVLFSDTPPPLVTLDDVNKNINYKFTEGVRLTEYGERGLCFVGPDNTYLTLKTAKPIVRNFGTGACDFEKGDITLTQNFEAGDENTYVEDATVGKDLAEKIPGLDEWATIQEESSAATKARRAEEASKN